MANINKREALMRELNRLSGDDEDIADIVKAFIDDIEDAFKKIGDTLSSINMDTLDSVSDARDTAVEYGESLY